MNGGIGAGELNNGVIGAADAQSSSLSMASGVIGEKQMAQPVGTSLSVLGSTAGLLVAFVQAPH